MIDFQIVGMPLPKMINHNVQHVVKQFKLRRGKSLDKAKDDHNNKGNKKKRKQRKGKMPVKR